MTELSVAISQKSRGLSSKRARCAKGTWAAYVKNRWPRGTQDEVRAEFGLTEWQARSVVYGEISQTTEDQIFNHKNGGALLALDLLLIRFSISCHDLANKLDEDAERDRLSREAQEESRRRFARRLADSNSNNSENI